MLNGENNTQCVHFPGFGFTLKGGNDFKLSDFYAGTSETFNPFYGVKEDGNVFDPANLSSLKEEVLKHTDDKGVHFLMADGVSCICCIAGLGLTSGFGFKLLCIPLSP